MGLIRLMINKYQLHKDASLYWKKKGAVIGDFCDIHSNATLGSEPYLVSIGNNVRINSGVQIITHDGGLWVVRNCFSNYSDVDLFGKVVIGNNVHIGTNAVIMPGVHVGSNCIIGVGAVVTHNIPDNSIAVGVPARVIESVDEYVRKHSTEYVHTKNFSPVEKRVFLKSNKLFKQ